MSQAECKAWRGILSAPLLIETDDDGREEPCLMAFPRGARMCVQYDRSQPGLDTADCWEELRETLESRAEN